MKIYRANVCSDRKVDLTHCRFPCVVICNKKPMWIIVNNSLQLIGRTTIKRYYITPTIMMVYDRDYIQMW